jgi:hypothetical protein
MTPEEIRSVVEAAVREGTHFPWWSYVLAAFLSLAGGYFGAYFRRKAEDRASRENFEVLRGQLQKTTQDTEEIKSALSRRTWLTQQQWNIRERFYSELVTNLALLKLSIEDRKEYFDEPGSEHRLEVEDTEHFKRLVHQGADAFSKLREQIGPASIFLSEKTISALEALVSEQWHISMDALCTADYVSTFYPYVEKAYTEILAEARDELRVGKEQT